MIQLIYSSTADKPFSSDALRTLLVRARVFNTAAEVSGMLLHLDGAFLQVLEGESGAIHALFARISADPRHTHVIMLLSRELEARNFPDWSMGFFDASGRGAALPGYRRSAGFSDLQGDAATILRVVTGFRDGRWRSLAVA